MLARVAVSLAVLAGCPKDDGGGTLVDDTGPVTEPPPEPERLEPAAACVDYLACLAAVGSSNLDLAEQVYGPDGDCWLDAAAALECSQACETGLAAELAADPTEVACWGEEVPASEALFAYIGDAFPVAVSGGTLCEGWEDFGLTLAGTPNEAFDATLAGLIDGLPYTFAQSCALVPGGAFACDAENQLLGWTGAFGADWESATLDLGYENAFTAFDCAVAVDLEGAAPALPPAPAAGKIVPTAVGFDLRADVSAGGLDLWGYEGDSYIPVLQLWFADARFFTSDEASVCYATFEFGTDAAYGGVATYSKPDQLPVADGAVMYASFEGEITGVLTTDCPSVVDPAFWGTGAGDLFDAFEGAHVGIGFAPMTTYLEGVLDPSTVDPEFEDALLAMYVAINDAHGEWIAHGWTLAQVWAVDPATGDVLIDEDGYFAQRIDVTGLAAGDDLPAGVVDGIPIWYQDFFLMDLGNLADAP